MLDVVFRSAKPMLGYGTSELRCVQPTELLREAGYTADCGSVYHSPVPPCRLLVLHRVADDGITRRAVKVARSLGAAILYDIDDFINDADDGDAFQPKIAAALARADHVTVSGPELEQRVNALGRSCTIITNKLSHDLIALAQSGLERRFGDGKINLGYFSGSATHDADFAMIAPALSKVLREFPNTRLIVAGKLNVDSGFDAPADQVVVEPFRPYREFMKLLAEIDINLAPLIVSSPFARARSEMKYIEAAAFGVPSVTSRTPAYMAAMDEGRTGVIVDGDGWYDAVAGLIRDSERRVAMGRAAREGVLRAYTPERGREDWTAIYEQLRNPEARAPVVSTLAARADLAGALLLRRGRQMLRGALR